MRLSSFLTLALLAGATALPSSAQTTGPTPAQITDAVEALEWRSVGPTIMGGRVSDLAVVESDPRVFYVATANEGPTRDAADESTRELANPGAILEFSYAEGL